MREVAQHAGVSVQTVSCVLNQTGSISEETRLRVQRSIEALNYRRNPIARSMRTQQTRMIALVVMDMTNPVLATIASTIEAVAYAQNYNVLLYNTGLDAARERTYLHEIEDRRVDGAVVVNAIDRQGAAHLRNEGVPTVLIDCAMPSSPLPTVTVDNFRGGYIATQHLIDLGHRRIAHIGGTRHLEIARQRISGYETALADANIDYRNVVSAQTMQWGYQSGYDAMKHLLASDERPTAVFAASDELAMGAYRALAEQGLRVPQDMSIVGFDNIEAAAFVTPPLTTVHQPFSQLGHQAFSLLLTMLDGNQLDPPDVLLPAEIIVRESTAEVL
jgi:DNA-binding LacI/PurR family transcriptional regulator